MRNVDSGYKGKYYNHNFSTCFSSWLETIIPPSSMWQPFVACTAAGLAVCTWSTTVTADVDRPWRATSPVRVGRSAGLGRRTPVDSSRRRSAQPSVLAGSTVRPAVTRNRRVSSIVRRRYRSSPSATWTLSSTSSLTAQQWPNFEAWWTSACDPSTNARSVKPVAIKLMLRTYDMQLLEFRILNLF